MTFDVTVGFVPGAAIMSNAQPVGAEYYRQKAEEIRQFAWQSKFRQIGEELFELADRFDRMAAAVERRQLVSTKLGA
jgi:hypothetical protein